MGKRKLRDLFYKTKAEKDAKDALAKKIKNSDIRYKYSKRMKREPTKAEYKLAKKLSDVGLKYASQVVIYPYIVDFMFAKKALIVELDGSQHRTFDGIADDIIRDAYLKDLGFDVIRFNNKEIFNNIEKVIEYIKLWRCLDDCCEMEKESFVALEKSNKKRFEKESITV